MVDIHPEQPHDENLEKEVAGGDVQQAEHEEPEGTEVER